MAQTVYVHRSERIPEWKKPDKLILRLIMMTFVTLNIIFSYQILINLIAPNMTFMNHFIITIFSICLVIDLAACLILYRYQSLIEQINEEIDRRWQAEEALKEANNVLENEVKKRIEELEQTNKGLHLEIMEREQAEEDLRSSEEKYRLLVNNMPGTVFRGYMDWTVDFFDDKVEELIGYKRSDFDSRKITWATVILEEDLEEAKRQFLRALKTDKSYAREYRIVNKKGEPLWIRERGQIICDEADTVKYISGVFFDITKRKQAEQELQAANEKLKGLYSEAAQQNCNIASLNEMSELLQTCLKLEEVYDTVATFGGRIFSEESGALYVLTNSKNLLEQVATWGEDPPNISVFVPNDCWALRRSRIYRYEKGRPGLLCEHASEESLFGYICAPLIAQSEVLGVLHLKIGNSEANSSIVSLEALLETKQRLSVSFSEHIALSLANLRLRESLRTQAIRDPLTGLFNRRYMEETIERECARVKRLSAPMGFIMMDLDRFKEFNDRFGHNVGDILLRQFGEWIKTQKRDEDIACRFGGEEFVLILPGASLDVSYERAEKLRLEFKHLQVEHNGKLHNPVTLSLGVAVFPDHGSTVEEIIRAADTAMYQAKRGGRDRVFIAQPMTNCHIVCNDKVSLPLQDISDNI